MVDIGSNGAGGNFVPIDPDVHIGRAQQLMGTARLLVEVVGRNPQDVRTVLRASDALDGPVGLPDKGRNALGFTAGLLAVYLDGQDTQRSQPSRAEETARLLDMGS
jgi:hypothetical protein